MENVLWYPGGSYKESAALNAVCQVRQIRLLVPIDCVHAGDVPQYTCLHDGHDILLAGEEASDGDGGEQDAQGPEGDPNNPGNNTNMCCSGYRVLLNQ